jgi:hypothetical protein
MKPTKIYSLIEIEAIAANYNGTFEEFSTTMWYYLKSSRKALNKAAKDLNVFAGKYANIHRDLMAYLVGGDAIFELYFYEQN